MRGSTPKVAAVSAELIAMSASCSESGLGLTAQSPYTSTRSASSMRNTLDTTETPGWALITWKAGRIVSPVVWAAPDTIPSTSPSLTMSVAK